MAEKTDNLLDALQGKKLTAAECSEATGEELRKTAAMLSYLKGRGLVDNGDGRWFLSAAGAQRLGDEHQAAAAAENGEAPSVQTPGSRRRSPPPKRAARRARTPVAVQAPIEPMQAALLADGTLVILAQDQLVRRLAPEETLAIAAFFNDARGLLAAN